MTLSLAIEGLYVAFASHQRHESIDGCPHCVGQEDQSRLARVPLRQLTADQLGRFAFKAMSTWGEPEDYAHFLPRILELAISNGGSLGFDLSLIAGKLQYARWRTWPPPEQAAVTKYFEALWREVLISDPRDRRWSASEVLPAIALLFDDLQPFLDAWEAEPSRLQLADFVETNWPDLARNGTFRRPELVGVKSWLLDPARKQALEAAFERNIDSPHADTLVAAIDAYQWMR